MPLLTLSVKSVYAVQCYRSILPTRIYLFGKTFSSSVPVCKANRKPKFRPLAHLKTSKNAYETEKLKLDDAVNVLRAVEVAHPNATYELIIKTAMGRNSTIPKGRMHVPHEVKPRARDRIFVFAEGEKAEEARRAGAEFVGGKELVDAVAQGRFPATLYLCTPDLIKAITPKLGRVLGPKSLMPSERRGTVTDDIRGYIDKISGSSEWKGDKRGVIRTAIAKMGFPVADVITNVRHFLHVVKEATGNVRSTEAVKRGGPKLANPITQVYLSSTQGPGIRISNP